MSFAPIVPPQISRPNWSATTDTRNISSARLWVRSNVPCCGSGQFVGAGNFRLRNAARTGGGEHVGAGPALVIRLMSRLACGFACAVCYSEFAPWCPFQVSLPYAYEHPGRAGGVDDRLDLILPNTP